MGIRRLFPCVLVYQREDGRVERGQINYPRPPIHQLTSLLTGVDSYQPPYPLSQVRQHEIPEATCPVPSPQNYRSTHSQTLYQMGIYAP